MGPPIATIASQVPPGSGSPSSSSTRTSSCARSREHVLEHARRLAGDVLQHEDAHQAPAAATGPRRAASRLSRSQAARTSSSVVAALPIARRSTCRSSQARVREVGLAARVDGLEQRLAARVVALGAEAHDRVGPRRAQLPARLVAHPALERLGEAHVLADHRLQPGAAVAAQHRPQLERAEAPAERGPVLVEVRDALGGRAQVLGREREGGAQIAGPRP